ncbi:MAG: DUF3298 and DUF4163 domain-containing protein [Intestinimonas sp.]|nr:DUF3298 and DUF4163 domain-containing protein [Intestinimonas sp.]
MELSPVSVKKNVIHHDLTHNGETLLTYKIEYPEFSASRFQACLLKLNRYYKSRALEFQQYCETALFSMAVEQYHAAMEHHFPVRTFEAMQVYEVTDQRACVLSVYFDRYEYTGGAHGNTIRTSQTWNLQTCGSYKLKQLVHCPPNYKTYLLTKIEAQIQNNPELYFENYEELIAEAFDKDHFYCMPGGIVVYYQQYDIAPYASGIRGFLIPYGGCVINPERLCRSRTI